MSRENVEIARLAYESYARRAVDRFRDRFADDFRFHTRAEFPGRSVHSLDEMPQIWADLDETYTEYSLVPGDFVDLGDYVLVTLTQSARLRGSDARIEMTIYHLWHIRDGKAREAWTYSDRAEAVEAAGR